MGADQYVTPASFAPAATGWHGIPGPVRFAIWLWAIVTIVSFIPAVIVGAVFVVALAVG